MYALKSHGLTASISKALAICSQCLSPLLLRDLEFMLLVLCHQEERAAQTEVEAAEATANEVPTGSVGVAAAVWTDAVVEASLVEDEPEGVVAGWCVGATGGSHEGGHILRNMSI